MKKLPKIYHSEIKSKKNNLSMYDSLKNNDLKIDLSNLSVKEKLQKLMNQNNYIFNTKVVLVFQDKEINTSIAGIYNNHIITMDNKIISIDKLIDIKIL
ncbi:MAG: hypothetical protein MR266_00045 [Erysipelotrichaceae bacterium]|nr:hypothetical protein [Erysipelotrichaceae bacterium]